MRIKLIVGCLLCTSMSLFAQEIDKKHLEQIRGTFEMDENTRAIQNILVNQTDLSLAALNHQAQTNVDHYFKYKVELKGNITDQQSSGRCWMFTSMNVIRPSVTKQFNLKHFDFSHNYNYFWDIFEKSNLFLENVIATADKSMVDREVETYFKSPVGDGGVWNLFYNIAEKYGVVPAEVMPETAHSNNTSGILRIINERLRVGGYELRNLKGKEQAKEKIDVLSDVYRILALCLGEPPVEFTWRYKTTDGEIKSLTTTPSEFYEMITPENYDPQTLIMIMNDPTREYYKVYEIANYRNTIEGVNWVYLNLPNNEIKASALESIKNNESMYTSCDVGKFYNRKTGVNDIDLFDYEALFGVNLGMDKKARILTRQSGSAHAMNLVAVDTDDNDKTLKWEFENSWGTAGNNGYITFTDRWFDEYIFRIVINKKYLSEKAIKALDQEPIDLPAWDYMF